MGNDPKWTSGPWKAERLGREIEIGAETPRGHLSVAWVHLGEAPTPQEVADGKSDAALIAAAPDLFAALAELVERRDRTCREAGIQERADGSDGRYARARAALEKALGSVRRAEGGRP